jgi:hypothetical protein
MTYFEKVNESSKNVMDDIQKFPFTKKLFNFIKNDLTGIINSFNDAQLSFEFNNRLIEKDFMNIFISILKKCEFHEQRYDKRLLKDELIKLFEDEITNGNVKPGKKELLNAFWFPLCDRELKFFTYIKNNYD